MVCSSLCVLLLSWRDYVTCTNVLAPVLREEISSLIQKQAIQVRPFLDLHVLNKHLKVCKFKILTLSRLLQSVHRSDWFTSIDLKDVYFHVAKDPPHTKFWSCLVVVVALAPVRCQGISVLAYLEDWLVVAELREPLELHTAMLVSNIQSQGFIMNHKKSCLNLAQRIQFLGLVLDSVLNHVLLSQHRVAFRLCLAQFLYDSCGASGTLVDASVSALGYCYMSGRISLLPSVAQGIPVVPKVDDSLAGLVSLGIHWSVGHDFSFLPVNIIGH